MDLYQNKYRIKSARLKEWDYSTAWWYYVTINTKNHIEWFGDVKNDKMALNEFGKIANSCWQEIPSHYLTVELDYYTIMPNHIHGIIILNNPTDVKTNNSSNQNITQNRDCRDVACNVSTQHEYYSNLSPKRKSLSVIIRSFKSAVTNEIHKLGQKTFQWQPRFYDRIIRNEKELFQIRKYIEQNPLKWSIENGLPENLDL